MGFVLSGLLYAELRAIRLEKLSHLDEMSRRRDIDRRNQPTSGVAEIG